MCGSAGASSSYPAIWRPSFKAVASRQKERRYRCPRKFSNHLPSFIHFVYHRPMARDYSWSRRFIPRDMLTTGEFAHMLDVGRHQAVRILKASGLPCRLVTRRWRHPRDGSWYVRRTYAIPLETAKALHWEGIERDIEKTLRGLMRRGCKLTPFEKRPMRDILADLDAIGRAIPVGGTRNRRSNSGSGLSRCARWGVWDRAWGSRSLGSRPV